MSKLTIKIFTANHCASSKMYKTKLGKDPIPHTYEIIDIEEKPHTAKEYGILGVPSTVIIKDGEVVKTLVGYSVKAYPDIKLEIEKQLKGEANG